MTDEEKEKILGALNYKDENGEERKSNNDLWLPLFLSMLAMSGSQYSARKRSSLFKWQS